MPEVGPLNLADADLKGFDAIPSGRYDAVVRRAEWRETQAKSADAKLPAGIPMLNVAFVVDGGEYDGRWVFTNYIIPSPSLKVDGKKYEQGAKMRGMFAKFLIASGYSEAEVTTDSFELDLEDLVGREVNVQVGQREYNGEMQNTVRAVRPRGDTDEGSGLL